MSEGSEKTVRRQCDGNQPPITSKGVALNDLIPQVDAGAALETVLLAVAQQAQAHLRRWAPVAPGERRHHAARGVFGLRQEVTLSTNAARFAIVRSIFSSKVRRSLNRPLRPITGFLPRRYREQAKSVQR